MINRVPALAALAVSAMLMAACADATSGTAVGGNPVPQSTGPTAFPTQQGPSTAVAGTAPVTPTPSPTPTTWSAATARQRYLDYVEPYNSHLVTLNKVLTNKKSSVASYHSICAQLATDELTFESNLRNGNWPASAKAAVAAFVPQIDKTVGSYRSCAAAKTAKAAISALNSGPDTQPYANAVRKVLGLPKVK